jgi:hypothetical protein
MIITQEMIKGVIDDFFRRCETARAIGIPLCEAIDGEDVPEDWELDLEIGYYLPPNVKLF